MVSRGGAGPSFRTPCPWRFFPAGRVTWDGIVTAGTYCSPDASGPHPEDWGTCPLRPRSGPVEGVAVHPLHFGGGACP